MLEREIQRGIIDFLTSKGCWVWKNPNTGGKVGSGRTIRTQTPGLPDLTVIIPGGRICYIEVKRPKGRLSSAQQKWIDKANSYGILAFVARSVEDVEETLILAGYL